MDGRPDAGLVVVLLSRGPPPGGGGLPSVSGPWVALFLFLGGREARGAHGLCRPGAGGSQTPRRRAPRAQRDGAG